MAVLAGANIIYGMGMLESGMMFDYGQLMLDAEIMRMVSFVGRGIEVNDQTLALDEIKDVGHTKDYMLMPLTIKHMRDLQSRPRFFDRSNRIGWEKAGEPNCYDGAVEKARDVLEHHIPDPLPDRIAKELREIVVESEKEWGAVPSNPDFEVGKGYLIK
jgi:trimethylamine--corrinoid protein Co-methyltransferase